MNHYRLLPLRLLLAALLLTACAPETPQATASQAPAPERSAQLPPQWRSPTHTVLPVLARNGMVVTTDQVASEIGAEVLRRGGNAADAAIATFFALAVINPEAGNIGGGGFLVAHTADGTSVALDFRETAPLAATRDMFLDAEGRRVESSLVGHLAAGVPGSVAGMWEAHQRLGSLSWSELLQPAITLAEGIVLHERLAMSVATYEERLRTYPATEAIFLPRGRAPRVGERFVQRDLAETLRRIAQGGADEFYRGRTAVLIAAEMRRGGGLIAREDLARYEARWRDPVSFTYRGYRIISMPPPSSGGVTLAAILNIIEDYDLPALGWQSAAHVHLFAETARRAFADRNAYLADPDFVPQPTERMISKVYAAERRATILPDRATPSAEIRPGLGPVPGEGENTTHLSVVDARGNAVAITTTLNCLYGNRVTVEGAGFLLNCEMDDFTVQPGIPNLFGLVQGEANVIEPGKRMLSAMTPTVVLAPSGRTLLVTGSPGGPTIITTVAQLISNLVDWGMDLPSAVVAPRLHHQHLPDAIEFERAGLAPEVVEALRAKGHQVNERPGYQGDAQSVLVLPDGNLLGVADFRRGGAAVGVREIREVVH